MTWEQKLVFLITSLKHFGAETALFSRKRQNLAVVVGYAEFFS